jgi:steroid delta-isomerase-like uncharacterized protein
MTGIHELVARYYDEVWVKGSLDACDRLLTDDYIDHNPPHGVSGDKKGAKQLVSLVTAGMSDQHFDLLDVIVEGDRAAAHWTWQWTQSGDWLGVPADGIRIVLQGHDFYRFRDGQISEIWHCDDFLGSLQALGAVVSLS